jgi:hypothetical protein
MSQYPDLAKQVDLMVGYRTGTVAAIGYCNTMVGTAVHGRMGGIAGCSLGVVFVGTVEDVVAVGRVVLFDWGRRVGCPSPVWVVVVAAAAVEVVEWSLVGPIVEGGNAVAAAVAVHFAARVEIPYVVAAAVVWGVLLVSERHPFPRNLVFQVAQVSHVVAVIVVAFGPVAAAAGGGPVVTSFAAEAAAEPVVAYAAAAIGTMVAVVACRAYPIHRPYLPVAKEARVAAVGDNPAAAAGEDNFLDKKDGSIHTVDIAAGTPALSPAQPVTPTHLLQPRPFPL